jgi:eukaryotic-like serine/threonine-protein kinase
MDPTSQTEASVPAIAAAFGSGDLSGQMLGDFRLLNRLGQGGMGQVYLAEQISLKRKVALKIMRTDVTANLTSFQRFKAEAEAIARITHGNIVQVHAFGEEAGVHYMALEYVEGLNLRQYIEKKGPPALPLALSIIRQVAAALQRASELGIVHRDIKPENILLTRRGEVKVADFGLSRCYGEQPGPNLTQPGLTMGTPLYMSPEQIQGQTVDARTDIYSFGVTCYHMLAGQPPFRGGSALELAIHHVQSAPQPLAELRPDLPAELCAMVHKMMAKSADDRYQTCNELLRDLARVREGLGQKTQAAGVSPAALTQVASAQPPEAVSGKKRLVSFAVASSLILAPLGGGLAAWLHARGLRVQAAGHPAPAETALTERQKREQFLLQAVNEYADPGRSRDKLELGLRCRLQLGVFYLNENRLDDAGEFFAALIANPHGVEAYKTLGRIGQAVVQARQNHPNESNQAFRNLLKETGARNSAIERLPFLLNEPELRREIGLALDYNKANATIGTPFPTDLEWLRQPPKWLTFPVR